MTPSDPKEPLAIQVNGRRAPRILLLLLLILSQQSAAYSCADSTLDLEHRFERYDVALVGTVEKKFFDLRLGTNRFLVSVESIKKGKVATDQLVVWSYSGRCGAKLKKGQRIVLFVKEDSGKYWANGFSYWAITERTERLTQSYKEFDFDND